MLNEYIDNAHLKKKKKTSDKKYLELCKTPFVIQYINATLLQMYNILIYNDALGYDKNFLTILYSKKCSDLI